MFIRVKTKPGLQCRTARRIHARRQEGELAHRLPYRRRALPIPTASALPSGGWRANWALRLRCKGSAG